MGKISIIFYIIFLIPVDTWAQDLSSLWQEYLPVLEERLGTSADFLEQLQYFNDHKLNINTVSASDLQLIPGLQAELIDSILTFIQQNTPIESLYQLQHVPGMTALDLRLLVLCCYPGSLRIQMPWEQVIGQQKTMLLYRFKPYPTDVPYDWKGNGQYHQFRFLHQNTSGWRWGIALEQDAGEQWKWNPSKRFYGMDVLNGFIQYTDKTKTTQTILGNYRIQFGQGLLVGSGFLISKGAGVLQTLLRPSSQIIPVANTSEYDRWFGVAHQHRIRKGVHVTVALSHSYSDARIIRTSTSVDPYITYLIEGGYHRTEYEWAARKTIEQWQGAAQVRWKKNQFSIGFQSSFRWIQHPIQTERTYYRLYALQGNSWYGHSVDIKLPLKQHVFFGEIAQSSTGGIAIQAGILTSLHRQFDVSVVYRQYSPSYFSPFAFTLSENTTVGNENAWLLAIKCVPHPKWNIHASVDYYRFPWLKYKVHSPSNGWEKMVRIDFKPTKKQWYYIQHRRESKPWDDDRTGQIESFERHHYVIGFEHQWKMHWKFRWKYQWGSYGHTTKSYGQAIAWDIFYQSPTYKIGFRWLIYATDDYASRQYMYSPDVAYSFQLPAYYGKGFEPTILAQYKINPQVVVWLRLSYVDQKIPTQLTPTSYWESTWQVKIVL
ncbi:MAG: helix-hairpin-helix domain-containing protein [Cytophagaceae bacterium]|jgi:hypothetical protein|nr:helix-hairpin-helix domain-containing protein [Cytophagaceae bacterium]